MSSAAPAAARVLAPAAIASGSPAARPFASSPRAAPERFASHPFDVAEDRLAELAASAGPLRRVLAAIAARLVATRAWERLCYARLSDYARERPGLSARQLQELARVHRALAELPALERALLTNALPWSKVRLVARVATRSDEEDWIARARAQPVRRLEQAVREHARAAGVEEPDDAEPATELRVRCTPAVREKWSFVRELAERVAGERLGAGEALEWVVAEAWSARPRDAARCDPAHAPPRPRLRALDGGLASTPRAPARALPPRVAALAQGLECADAFELDRRIRLAVRFEQTLDAEIAPLLRRVHCGEYEWRRAWCALGTFAREALGMSASKARSLLRLERAAEVCPELRSAWRSGQLSWVKAQCLAPLLLLDLPGAWRPVWVAWAERVTVRRLERDVERALLLRAGHAPAWRRCQFDPERAQDPIPPHERQMCAHEVDVDATEGLVFHLPREVAALFFALRLPFEALLDHAMATWMLRDPAQRRPNSVIERDGYRCTVPGCTSRRNLHDHHIAFRSAGGSDEPANRVTLCAFHHLRCVHAGLLRIRGRAPEALVFELPLALYRSGDVFLPQSPLRQKTACEPGAGTPPPSVVSKSDQNSHAGVEETFMKRFSIGLAALAAFVAFSGMPVVASAEGSVKCEVTKEGKKEVRHVKTNAECTKMGGKVVHEPKASTPPAQSTPKTN